MIAQNELGHGLEHGYHHRLTHARLASCVKCRCDGVDRVQTRYAIRQRGRGIGRLRHAVLLHEPWDTCSALDQVVVGGAVCIGSVLVKATATDMNDAQIALAYRRVVQSQPGQSLGSYVADEHITSFSYL